MGFFSNFFILQNLKSLVEVEKIRFLAHLKHFDPRYGPIIVFFFQSKWIFEMMVISKARVRITRRVIGQRVDRLIVRTDSLWRSQFQVPLPMIFSKTISKTYLVGFEHSLWRSPSFTRFTLVEKRMYRKNYKFEHIICYIQYVFFFRGNKK